MNIPTFEYIIKCVDILILNDIMVVQDFKLFLKLYV